MNASHMHQNDLSTLMPMETDIMSNNSLFKGMSRHILYQLHSNLWLEFLNRIDQFPIDEYNDMVKLQLIRYGRDKLYY